MLTVLELPCLGAGGRGYSQDVHLRPGSMHRSTSSAGWFLVDLFLSAQFSQQSQGGSLQEVQFPHLSSLVYTRAGGAWTRAGLGPGSSFSFFFNLHMGFSM